MQVLDRNGRVIVILPLPGSVAATSVVFGGAAFDTMYVATDGGRIFRRKLHVVGVRPSAAPTVIGKGSAG